MQNEDEKIKPHLGSVNFERRKHPRFSINLPIEYAQIDNSKDHLGSTNDISEGGLLLSLSDAAEIGQILRIRIPYTSLHDSTTIEALVQVVWKDFQVGKDRDYRLGAKFIDISPVDMNRLRRILWKD